MWRGLSQVRMQCIDSHFFHLHFGVFFRDSSWGDFVQESGNRLQNGDEDWWSRFEKIPTLFCHYLIFQLFLVSYFARFSIIIQMQFNKAERNIFASYSHVFLNNGQYSDFHLLISLHIWKNKENQNLCTKKTCHVCSWIRIIPVHIWIMYL